MNLLIRLIIFYLFVRNSGLHIFRFSIVELIVLVQHILGTEKQLINAGHISRVNIWIWLWFGRLPRLLERSSRALTLHRIFHISHQIIGFDFGRIANIALIHVILDALLLLLSAGYQISHKPVAVHNLVLLDPDCGSVTELDLLLLLWSLLCSPRRHLRRLLGRYVEISDWFGLITLILLLDELLEFLELVLELRDLQFLVRVLRQQLVFVVLE